MPKVAKELTALEVKRIKTAGMHAVGGVAGLLLQVRTQDGSDIPSARSWILRTRLGTERIHMGLGSYPTVGLAEARETAKARLLECRQGINPIQKRKADRSALLTTQAKAKTFREVADAYLKAHTEAFSNLKHRQQWQTTLETYVHPLIGNRLVSTITPVDIVNVLEQPTNKNPRSNKPAGKFWEVKTETASRVQGRMKLIFDYAIGKEYRTGNNPARWDGVLSAQLPSPKKIAKVRHHPALPYIQAPKFMATLRKNKSISSAALQFLILTAVRSGSVRRAAWPEIDLQKKIWTIPPENTKTKEEHRVPLSPETIKLLKKLPRFADTPLIFPGKNNKPLSDMALSELMRGMFERGEMAQHAVPHGWRSTFRDWAAEQTDHSDEVRKVASGHSVGDAVKAAYQRTDLLEKRRKLMNEWAKYLEIRTPRPKKKSRSPKK